MGCLSSREVPYQEQPEQAGRAGSLSADSVLKLELEKQERANKEIENYMKEHRATEEKTKKLLLLGAGSSGKSTLFKQLKKIYPNGKPNDWGELKKTIQENAVHSMIVLLTKSETLYKRDRTQHADCFIDLQLEQHAAVVTHIQRLMPFTNRFKESHFELSEEACSALRESLSYLWALPQVKNTFHKRQHFSLIENVDYFLSKIDDIFDVYYEPSFDDMLKCRARTTGQYDEEFEIKGTRFTIWDAGGQRSERKKWIQMFEGVTAVIFVAALNHYATVLFEDEGKNSMHESLQLWKEIINAKWFRKTEMILFLNKDDIFRERIREEVPLSIAFSDEDEDNIYDTWSGPDYHRTEDEDEEEDELQFKECHAAALDFIRKQYEKLNKQAPRRQVYVHVTDATNTGNVESVFWDVQSIVVQGNLKTSGLVF